jgi:5'-nucleotidase
VRVAITNDDGIRGRGIAVIARSLEHAGHDVTIVCPNREMSGVGTSTGADLRGSDGVRVVQTEVEGVRAFAVDGPPALCTLLALRGLMGAPPDFLVSGINAGPNLGISTLHSGTVGAVMTAANAGVSGLAVSLALPARVHDGHFETAAAVAAVVIEEMADRFDERVITANLNVPNVPLDELRGLRITELDSSPGFRSKGIEVRETDEEGTRVKFLYERLEIDPPESTDVGALAANYASLSWLRGFATALAPEWHGEIVGRFE